jgi:hypothetical protein
MPISPRRIGVASASEAVATAGLEPAMDCLDQTNCLGLSYILRALNGDRVLPARRL